MRQSSVSWVSAFSPDKIILTYIDPGPVNLDACIHSQLREATLLEASARSLRDWRPRKPMPFCISLCLTNAVPAFPPEPLPVAPSRLSLHSLPPHAGCLLLRTLAWNFSRDVFSWDSQRNPQLQGLARIEALLQSSAGTVSSCLRSAGEPCIPPASVLRQPIPTQM